MEQMQNDASAPGNPIPMEIRMLAAFGYLPMLFILPLIFGQRYRFSRFHGFQSLFLLIGLALIWIAIFLVDVLLGNVLGKIILLGFIFKATAWIIHNLVGTVISIIYLILTVYCFVQAAAGQEWRIPVVGILAQKSVNYNFNK
ncbi:MAG: hypothetical protein N2248_03585 [candidate division WOR-3 bacterium]|uniref:DUF4870 domain-containing protein n=1 Tax=candidate division WOR-3 bacterium TaxID=2052148 RepID=A0A7C1SQG1_UNCW3|nr:hypothetical protein [candidate division WOR-3 bacterium]